MKIAFINIYQNKVSRGAETFVSELSTRLSKNSDVKVLGGAQSPKSRWPILWRVYLDPFGIQTFWQTFKLLPYLWKQKFDVVIPVNGGWQPALVRILTLMYGGKMLISGQSGIGWDDRNNLWCFPDIFIALSSKAEGWAKNVNPLVRVKYIPNGVDLKKFGIRGSILKNKLKYPVIVCQGALEPSKRLDLTIKAVSRLKDASLLILGDGSLRSKLHMLCEKYLKDKYEIIHLPHNKMPGAYRAGVVFTLPSWSSEAFGIAYVEAMACGLPVVATDDSIRREIVGEAGIFVDPEDTRSYATALSNALNTNWGDKPQVQAKKFDWDKIAVKYEESLQKIIR